MDTNTLNTLRSQYPEFTWKVIDQEGVYGAEGEKDGDIVRVVYWADSHQWVAYLNDGDLNEDYAYTACRAVQLVLPT